jgi:signal transduction histidine kinase
MKEKVPQRPQRAHPRRRATDHIDVTKVFAGGSEMASLMRGLDWSSTSLGQPGAWPQSLRTAVSILLPSKAQIILFWGPQYVVLYNDAYRPVFGAKHPQMLGQPGSVAWSEVWESGARLHGLLDGVVRTGEAFSAQDLLFLIERYGFMEETYFDVSYDPVRVESGEVGGVFCIVTETTGRVVGERRLALLRDLAARNSSARSARDACALAMETLAARPQDIPFALAYLDGELQAGTPGAEQARAAASPALVQELSMGAGRLVVGLNPLRPFDEQYRSFLDLVSGQLATAIANAQAYEEERKRAEALADVDRAKTAFFSNVSHEFRTPLTLILGPVADLLDASLDSAQRSQLELVQRNALRLRKLVNSLLDFSRIQAGRVEASYEPTDLSAKTAELVSMFRSATERAGLELTLDAPPLSQPVYVDREMWEKIVLNLLSNAVKFTFEGGILVSVREGGDHVEVAVRDTGTGIPADQIPHLFQRFHRVEGARSRTHEGSGIGLALVKELVDLHRGTIGVESHVGVGTAFKVSLPFGSSHLPAERVGAARTLESTALGGAPFVEEALGWLQELTGEAFASQLHDALPGSRPASGFLATSPSPAHVLVVDDNADMREYLRRLLSLSWRVTAVADGVAALAAARELAPDLVLADVMMPNLDGFGLLAELRSSPETRDLPILLLSARAGEEAHIEGMEAGADDYLVKPFSARELHARVAGHLEIARLRRRAAEERERLLEAERLARHAAEDANQAKVAFLTMMSHELRTPLNAILGFCHLLEEEVAGPLLEGQRKQLQRIDGASRHLLQIIEQILSFARIEAGREELLQERVDLSGLIRETASFVEPIASSKQLVLEVGAPSTPQWVITDKSKVRQILLNLLANAIKFTNEGSVGLDLKSSGNRVEVSVRDTGIGIAAADLEGVFEPFYQVRQLNSAGGTGLGLSVSRKLSRFLGGELTATSEPGKGSVFTLRLPTAPPTGELTRIESGSGASSRALDSLSG